MYNNKEYWSERELSDTPNDPRVEKYIKEHLQGDKDYHHMVTYLYGYHDTVVCSKVFLHISPNELEKVISGLKIFGKRIIVWDIDRPDGAEHVFNHDFSKYFDMKDVKNINGQILFYAALDH